MHKHGGNIYDYKNIIDFSANINPFGMASFVEEAAKMAVTKANVYPDVEYRKLKAAIAKREGVNENNIICGNGAAEIIFTLCYALRPKKAMVLSPTFEEYRQGLEAVNCEVLDYKLEESKNFKLDENFLEALPENLDMLFLCNPNNPTGNVIEINLLKKIVEICNKKNIFVVIDMCFNDFLINEYPLIEGAFILKAFTKMYGMAGLRLGYGIYNNTEFLDNVRKYVQPWSVSVIAQEAGLAAANDREFYVNIKNIISKEKLFLLNGIENFVDKIYGHDANYIFFKADVSLKEKLLEKGILIRDCSNFIGLSQGYFRIAVKGHEDNVIFLNKLKEVYYG